MRSVRFTKWACSPTNCNLGFGGELRVEESSSGLRSSDGDFREKRRHLDHQDFHYSYVYGDEVQGKLISGLGLKCRHMFCF